MILKLFQGTRIYHENQRPNPILAKHAHSCKHAIKHTAAAWSPMALAMRPATTTWRPAPGRAGRLSTGRWVVEQGQERREGEGRVGRGSSGLGGGRDGGRSHCSMLSPPPGPEDPTRDGSIEAAGALPGGNGQMLPAPMETSSSLYSHIGCTQAAPTPPEHGEGLSLG